MKSNNKIVVFFVLVGLACVFAVWGMLTPPPGQIDNSILILIAQFLVLGAGVYGFELHVDAQKGKVDAGKRNDEENEDISA